MSFVRTQRRGPNPEPYIPGSSLKGVIRAHAERLCRSLREEPVPVCLPYLKPGQEQGHEQGQASCGLRLEAYKRERNINTIATETIYRLSCPVCRLCGSHSFIGRLATADAHLTDTPLLEIRDGVAIDRFTGGAAPGAKYDLEVLTRGTFTTVLEVRNFERWQLGLLGLVLRDLAEGLVRLGFRKSRGLGRIAMEIRSFRLIIYNVKMEHLCGLAALSSPEEGAAYGFFPELNQPRTALPAPEETLLRYTYDITNSWQEVLAPAVADCIEYIKTVRWPENIDAFTAGGRP